MVHIFKKGVSMSRFFITGDTHGHIDSWKLVNKKFTTHSELTKNDYVIIAGDFGCCWFGGKDVENTNVGYIIPPSHSSKVGKDDALLDWFEAKSYTTLFVDGNHENHKLLNTFPVEEWNGGLIHRIRPSVIHLMRGQVYEIAGKKFFTMGGAQSMDKEYRKEDVSWWEEELPSEVELQIAVNNLEKHKWKVDYVISHCCGNNILYRIEGHNSQRDCLTDFFMYVDKQLEYKMWYFGHHHIDRQIGDKHRAMYQDIIEVL